MKKTLLIILACMPLWVQAQTYDTISGPDGRYYKYHYTTWFDSCGFWSDTQTRSQDHSIPGSTYIYNYGSDGWSRISPWGDIQPAPTTYAKTEYIPRQAAVKGVAVVTSNKTGDPWTGWYITHPTTAATSDTLAPDTCFVFNVVNGDMNILNSARWDTATPKIYKVPWHEDSARAGFAYFEVFEVYFKTPFEVNDTFYIVGTPYNNEVDGRYGHYLHPPHFYGSIKGMPLPDDPCLPPDHWERHSNRFNNPPGYTVTWGGVKPQLSRTNWQLIPYGAFFPILSYDSVSLSVSSNNNMMGRVSPQGTRHVLKWVSHTISAVPDSGFRFTHWNDGNTDNPRIVMMDKDTSFTAYFEPKPQYTVSVGVGDPNTGHVTGGGIYYDLDTVMIEAVPSSDRYTFDFWGDGNVYNPRYVVVRSDTSFTAFFKDLTAIDEADASSAFFTLTPNPTDGQVSVEVSGGRGTGVIALCDATGREVLKQKASAPTTLLDLSTLPAGTYFVTVTIGGQSGTRKLVVK